MTCAVKPVEVSNVTVATIAMMKNPTKNTLSKMTMSMMTKMATVLHRDLENDCSSSPCSTPQSVSIQDALWSLRCGCLLLGLYDRVLVSVVDDLSSGSSNVNSSFQIAVLSNASMPSDLCRSHKSP